MPSMLANTSMTKHITRYATVAVLVAAASIWWLLPTGQAETVTVYKTPTCGCCSAWVDYLRDEGFEVEAHNLTDLTDVRAQHGLTDRRLMSCHTAVVGGYVVEGHVPVDDIRRLLNERPDVVGITAPGMPQLSPGMASRIPQDYDVLSFDKRGRIERFSRY